MADRDMVDRAERFVWLNGRVLERRWFAYLFRSGDADDVVAALRPYQNADGGFGHALEPEFRGPSSQPPHVHFALRQLDEIGRCQEPLVTRVCDYLASVTAPDGGVPTILPSIRDEPRTPLFSDVGDAPPGALLLTAAMVGLLYKNRIDHPWLDPATAFCWRAIGAITATHPYEVEACLPFLDHVPDRAAAERAAERLGRLVREQRLVALDPATPIEAPSGYAPGEVHTPLDYAPRSAGLARRWFSDEEIARDLDDLEQAQGPDGGWPINFPVWTPITGLEWRTVATVEALARLRAYGRLR